MEQSFTDWITHISSFHTRKLKDMIIFPVAIIITMQTAVGMLYYSWSDLELTDVTSYILLIAGILLFKVTQKSHEIKILISLELLNLSCFIHYYSSETQFPCVFVLISSMMTLYLSHFVVAYGRIIYLLQLKSVTIWILADKHRSASVIPNNFGVILGITSIFLVITRNYLLKQLAMKHKYKLFNEMNFWHTTLLSTLYEIQDAVLILDSCFKIQICNRSAMDLFLTRDIHEIRSRLETLNYIDSSRFYEYESDDSSMFKDIKHFMSESYEYYARLGITMENNIYSEWKVKKYEHDSKVFTILIAHNITNSCTLSNMNSKISATNEILATVAHELRTPTSTIISVSDQILEERSSYSPEFNSKLTLISVCSKIMLNLTNDLLDFFKVMSGTLTMQSCCIDIREFLSECMSIISVQCRMKGLYNHLIVDNSLPFTICTDPNRLRQIILNLLSNALKFTSTGGITLKAKRISINVCKISVKDTGVGIQPDKIHKLFVQFSKLEDPELNPYGCGLGLHISNILVAMLGKTSINVKSVPGQGSTFTFSFEYTLNEAEAAKELVRLDSASNALSFEENVLPLSIPILPIKRSFSKQVGQILIADDNDFSRSIIGEFLREAGILFNEATNGLQALEEIRSKNKTHGFYKLVIMDCQMPIMDGWTASKEISELYNNGEIAHKPYILAYTAYRTTSDIDKCTSCGVVEVLQKPVSKRVFIETVSKYLIL